MKGNKEVLDLSKRVRRIEIKARGLSEQVFAGQYHSAFKGRGMTFSEVRNYQFGDDVRDLDWNVTARYAEPFVKVFEEDRELSLMLLVDLSSSTKFGSQETSKQTLMTELAATLAFSAIKNNDKIGAILFTDQVELFIPPKSGKKHVLYITQQLLSFKPQHKRTNIEQALTHLVNLIKKRCTAFLISDFFHSPTKWNESQNSFRLAAKKHDLICIQVFDQYEQELPDLGLMKLYDYEEEQEFWIDSSDKKTRESYTKSYNQNLDYLKDLCKRSKVDLLNISTNEDFTLTLSQFFKSRG